MSKVKTQEREIAGKKFRSTKLPASINFPLSTRVGELLSEALSTPGVMGLFKEGTTIETLDLETLAPVLQRAFGRLVAVDSLAFAITLLQGTTAIVDASTVKLDTVEGIDAAFDDCSLLVMYKVLAFAIEVNFGDFFAGSAGNART